VGGQFTPTTKSEDLVEPLTA